MPKKSLKAERGANTFSKTVGMCCRHAPPRGDGTHGAARGKKGDKRNRKRFWWLWNWAATNYNTAGNKPTNGNDPKKFSKPPEAPTKKSLDFSAGPEAGGGESGGRGVEKSSQIKPTTKTIQHTHAMHAKGQEATKKSAFFSASNLGRGKE